jgi:transcriptional regulator with XRE-family HTH domain
MTMAELARSTDLEARTIGNYESGETHPSNASLLKIERVLGFTREFFTGDDLEEPNSAGVSFRSLARMTAKLRDMALSQGAFALEVMSWLEKRFDLPLSNLPPIHSGEFGVSASCLFET